MIMAISVAPARSGSLRQLATGLPSVDFAWAEFRRFLRRLDVLHGVASELIAHGGQQFGGVALVLPTDEPHLQGKRDHRRANLQVDRLFHRPAAFPRIRHPAFDSLELGILLEGCRGQICLLYTSPSPR